MTAFEGTGDLLEGQGLLIDDDWAVLDLAHTREVTDDVDHASAHLRPGWQRAARIERPREVGRG